MFKLLQQISTGDDTEVEDCVDDTVNIIVKVGNDDTVNYY